MFLFREEKIIMKFLFLKQMIFTRMFFRSENRQWFKMALSSTKIRETLYLIIVYICGYTWKNLGEQVRKKRNKENLNKGYFFVKFGVPFTKPNELNAAHGPYVAREPQLTGNLTSVSFPMQCKETIFLFRYADTKRLILWGYFNIACRKVQSVLPKKGGSGSDENPFCLFFWKSHGNHKKFL